MPVALLLAQKHVLAITGLHITGNLDAGIHAGSATFTRAERVEALPALEHH